MFSKKFNFLFLLFFPVNNDKLNFIFSFAVTAEMVEPHLDGSSLEEALRNKRIYIVNLDVLSGIVCKECRIVSNIIVFVSI